MKNIFSKLLLPCLLLSAGGASARVELPKIFTDNMVLQQQTQAPIWGKAAPGKEVKIVTSWDNKTYTTTADQAGRWSQKLATPKAGNLGYNITISDGKPLTLKNVLIGEVWVCSGQSNMEMPLAGWGKINNYEAEIAAASHPQIRLLHINQSTATLPQDEVSGTRNGWQECSPATVAEFSATAYFFGRNLQQTLNVPIGLINASWGGTIAEAWTSGAALNQFPEFRPAVKEVQSISEADARSVAGNPNRPGVLYNAMIHPLTNFAMQGVIWYQGESNEDRAYQYRELLPLMVRDWRKAWQRDFPFYYVQLANYTPQPSKGNWALLRESQLQTLSLANTGMAITIDIGDARDIHPKNKQDVGLRLALVARRLTYWENIAYAGPHYHTYAIEGDKIRIRFSHVDEGLKSKDGEPLREFTIAGPDHQFHKATAFITTDNSIGHNAQPLFIEVIVSAPEVEFPVAVRYSWSDNPDGNLYNNSNLPASPFRTDSWDK